jgi:hypothetical protein
VRDARPRDGTDEREDHEFAHLSRRAGAPTHRSFVRARDANLARSNAVDASDATTRPLFESMAVLSMDKDRTLGTYET